MKPLITPPDPVDPDEGRRKREYAAYERFRRIVVGDTPTAPLPDWRGHMRPAGTPNPRDALIAEFMSLRLRFTPPVPAHERQWLGPLPSDPKVRLVEGPKKSGPNNDRS